ncbi:hypothetical protein FHW69_002721 [Luteibacter sp. Sphag1AF]|uniref:MASE1 domain-containing protein n=1 Tax=Luteibacter sp. Sphag1AF TaxID=2587031 RepID=UPI00161570B6|nr:hypothetical protein [Luteibacter sp. Sphag1AF]
MRTENKDSLTLAHHAAIASAYAACYVLTRYFSFSHWILPAGLRLVCLLLLPRRVWPALAIGETITIAESALLDAPPYGLAWMIAASFPPIVLCMPAVALIKRHLNMLKPDGHLNMAMLLVASMACAALNTLGNAVALASVHMPDGSPAPHVAIPVLLTWFLGAYLGALTLMPTLLAIREWVARHGDVLAWRTWSQSRLLRDLLFWTVPTLAVLAVAAPHLDDAPRQWCRLLMVLPVAVLTARHGWQGGALGGMLASIAQASTATTVRDPQMIQAQVVLAFAISTSLIVGVRMAARVGPSALLRIPFFNHLRMAHAGVAFAEAPASPTRAARNHVQARTRFRDVFEGTERQPQAAPARVQLPSEAPVAFESSFATAVQRTGANYRYSARGLPLAAFEPAVERELQRMASELIPYALATGPCQDISLQLRAGMDGDRPWLVLRVVAHRSGEASIAFRSPRRWAEMIALLGSRRLDLAAMQAHAAMHGGMLRVRQHARSIQASFTLHEPRLIEK